MTPEVSVDFVLKKCKFFTTTHVWPIQTKLDPIGWLANFSDDDKKLAAQLLNSFLYYSANHVDRLFISAVHGLSRTVTDGQQTPFNRQDIWRNFLSSAIFTFPTGETPFVGDSGHLFVRRVREKLTIEEESIQSPEEALKNLASGNAKTVIFVDDIVGTGQQFLKTWERYSDEVKGSFDSVQKSNSFSAYYCPLFCTAFSIENHLKSLKQKVEFAPAHWIEEQHSLLSVDSVWWPEHMRKDGVDLIRKYSIQQGLPDSNGYDTQDWRGYNSLGLALSFEHSCPDATIPLFNTTLNGWRPLWKQ